MTKFAESVAARRGLLAFVPWLLIAIYSAARILQILPGKVSMLTLVILHVLPPLLFAMFYRVRGILAFVAISVIVGGVFEYVGVRTAFPYGCYYFTDVMGPKVSVVPIFLGLAYVGMGYLSWTLAVAILGGARSPLPQSQIVALAVIAAFIMLAWDWAMDPVWSTVLRAWIWANGGMYFGVPVANFFGWYLTMYVIYQLFALFVLKGRALEFTGLGLNYWRQALLFYTVSAAGNVLLVLPRTVHDTVFDPSGRKWRVHDISAAAAFISIFVMGSFAVVAWVRLGHRTTSGEALAKCMEELH